MSRTVYVNGQWLPEDAAQLSVFDRATLFGDSVYDVAGVLDGKLIDFAGHCSRLQRSLKAIDIVSPLSDQQVLELFQHGVAVNGLQEGLVYIQISRGIADRDFVYPADSQPSVIIFTMEKNIVNNPALQTGITLITHPDLRWQRRDIKSVNLLAQVMAKQYARQQGGAEALLVDQEGYVTEGASSSFFWVKDNTVFTRPLSNDILPGITRQVLLELCDKEGCQYTQANSLLTEVLGADEAFITSASNFVLPVNKIDEHVVGNGQPGTFTMKMRERYLEQALASAQ